MYTNLNTGEIIPWQAESFKYNADFTAITVKLRQGMTWSDGQPFTADDVKYTLEMLRDNSPDLLYSAIYKEWVKGVDGHRPADRRHQPDKPAPALLPGQPGARPREPPGHAAGAHLERPGPEDVHQLRPGQGLAVSAPAPTSIVPSTAQQQIARPPRRLVGRQDRLQGAAGAASGIILDPGRLRRGQAQLYIANKADSGNPLQPGTFVAAQARRTRSLQSWTTAGPGLGRARRLRLRLHLQQQKAPWNNVNVRIAINYAINRQQISSIGYNSANYPGSSRRSRPTWPRAGSPARSRQSLDKYDRGTPIQAKVDEHMRRPATPRTRQGMWAKDGQTLKVPVRGPQFFAPLAPPLHPAAQERRLRRHRERSSRQARRPGEDQPSASRTRSSSSTAAACREPYETLKDLHSK